MNGVNHFAEKLFSGAQYTMTGGFDNLNDSLRSQLVLVLWIPREFI